MWRFLAFLIVAPVLLAGTLWFVLQQPPIGHDTLESAYGTARSDYLTFDNGLRVHVREAGDPAGAPLVLVHGFAASQHTWEAWEPHLGDTFRLIALDLPGHGLTRKPEDLPISQALFVDTIGRVADAKGLDRFALAGSSMGGEASWRFALGHPERVEALILVGSAGWDNGRGPTLLQRAVRYERVRGALGRTDFSYMMRQGLENAYADPSQLSEDTLDRYVSLSRAPGRQEAVLEFMASRAGEPGVTPAQLAPLEALPVLILHGEQDRLVAAEAGEKFHAAIPGSELITYPSLGHLPQEEAPAQTAADVRAFLSDAMEGWGARAEAAAARRLDAAAALRPASASTAAADPALDAETDAARP